MKITVHVPATTANLGPGFDCLGLALDCWNTIVIETRDSGIEVRVRGLAEGLAADASNTTVQAMLALFERAGVQTPGLRVTMTNRIPIGRGLGSSAAAIVGGLVGANIWARQLFTDLQLLELATEIEGHPDNVSAALYGGMTIVVEEEAGLRVARVKPPEDWRAVLFIPDAALSTKFARQVLPKRLSRADAVHNIGRAALLTYAFATGDAGMLSSATQDRLHQPYRAPLVRGMAEMLEAAQQCGACGAALSGAGPSLIAIAGSVGATRRAAAAFRETAQKLGLNGQVWALRLSARGAYGVKAEGGRRKAESGRS